MADDSVLLTYEVDGLAVIDFFTELNSIVDETIGTLGELSAAFDSLSSVDEVLASISEAFATLDASVAETTASVDELSASVDEASVSLADEAVSADEAASSADAMDSSMQGAQGGLLLIAGAAVMAGKSFLDMGIQAQNGFSLVQGMAGDTTLPQYMGQLQQQASDLGVTMSQEASALYEVDSAGYSLANGGLTVLRYAQEAAKAGAASTGVVASALTSELHAYNLTAKDAGKVTDEMIQTVVLGKQQFSDLASAIGPLVAVGHNVGLSLEEVNAAEATMTQINPNVRMDVNELKLLFNATSLSVQGVADTAKKLNLHFDETTYTSDSLIERLKYLAEISGGTNTTAFKKLTGGAAGMQAALMLLSGGSKTYENNLKALQHAQGATDKAFQVSEQTITSHVDHIKSSLSILATQAVTAISPMINGALQSIGGMFDWLGQHQEILMPLLAGLATMLGVILVGAIGLLVMAISPALAVIIGFAAIAGAAVAIFGGTVKAAFDEMAREANVKTLEMKIKGIQHTQEQAEGTIRALEDEKNGVLQQLKEAKTQSERIQLETKLQAINIAEEQANGVIAKAKKEREGVEAELEKLDPATRLHALKQKQDALQQSQEQALGVVGNIAGERRRLETEIAEAHDAHTKHMLSMKLEALDSSAKQAEGVVANIKKEQQGVAQQMKQATGQVQAEQSNPFVNMWHGLQSLWPQIMGAFQQIGGYLQTTFAPVVTTLSKVWQEQLLPALQQIGTALKPLLVIFGAMAALFVGSVIGALKGTIGAIAAFVSGIARVIGSVIQSIEGAVQIISGIIHFFIDLVTGNFQGLSDDIQSIWTGIQNFFGGIFGAIGGLFGTFFSMIGSAIHGWLSGIIGFFQWLADKLVGHSIIPDMLNAIVHFFLGLPGRMFSALGSLVSAIVGKFVDLWNNVSSLLGNAFNTYIAKPLEAIANLIVQWAAGLATSAFQWGVNLLTGFLGGLKSVAGAVGGFFSGLGTTIHNFLGFGSPTKEGPGRTADQWAPNLMKMYAQGIEQGVPLIELSARKLVGPLAVTLQGGLMGGSGSPASPQGVIGGMDSSLMSRLVTAIEKLTSSGNGSQGTTMQFGDVHVNGIQNLRELALELQRFNGHGIENALYRGAGVGW